MDGKNILRELMKGTYRESRDFKDAIIEDFLVNLNPFLRPAHYFKAVSAYRAGDELSAMVHTIQANAILPPLPTGLVDYLKNEGKLPELPE